jgi:hypothetical protein
MQPASRQLAPKEARAVARRGARQTRAKKRARQGSQTVLDAPIHSGSNFCRTILFGCFLWLTIKCQIPHLQMRTQTSSDLLQRHYSSRSTPTRKATTDWYRQTIQQSDERQGSMRRVNSVTATRVGWSRHRPCTSVSSPPAERKARFAAPAEGITNNSITAHNCRELIMRMSL